MADTVINFENMKQTSPERNFDNVDITEDFNVAAQNAQGLYGAFKFFHGIRSFFKGISALGTLATGSKILVADDSGNISYTTPSKITDGYAKTTEVNNALANLDKIKNNGDKTNANDCFSTTDGFSLYCLPSSAKNIPELGKAVFIQSNTRWTSGDSAYITQFGLVVDTSAGTTEWRIAQSVYTRNGNNLNGVINFSSWQKLTTESDLKPTITPITTTSTEVSIVDGGFSKIGNLVVVNFRFTVTRANTLITFATNVPYAMRPPIATKQYIPANVINIQQDIPELCYGYKAHSSPNFIVNVSKINVEYALSCTYICS